MFGLQLSHAVRVEEVIEGDSEQVLQRVAQVTLPTETQERLDRRSDYVFCNVSQSVSQSTQLDPLSFLFTTLNPRVLSNYQQETSNVALETYINY